MVFSGEKLKIKSIKTDCDMWQEELLYRWYNDMVDNRNINGYYWINIYAIKGRTK